MFVLKFMFWCHCSLSLTSFVVDSVDRGAVPRMPWHDVGMRTFGASARDVARHFILRWNATKVIRCFWKLKFCVKIGGDLH